jgi:hypothetical protein
VQGGWPDAATFQSSVGLRTGDAEGTPGTGDGGVVLSEP